MIVKNNKNNQGDGQVKKILSMLLAVTMFIPYGLILPASADSVQESSSVQDNSSAEKEDDSGNYLWYSGLNDWAEADLVFVEEENSEESGSDEAAEESTESDTVSDEDTLENTEKTEDTAEENKLAINQSKAAAPESSSSTYGDFEYEINNGDIEITKYNGSSANVTIPDTINGDTVTIIGDSAFRDCSNLQTVKFPNKLETVGKYAFSNCVKLKSADLPDTVETIGGNAFEGCKKLESFHYPLKWSEVNLYWSDEGNIFYNCENLKTITVPEGVKRIPDYAFQNSNCLETVFLPSTLEEVGYSSFSDCENLTAYCPKYTKAAITLIDNKVNVVSSNDNRSESPRVTDISNSRYSLASGSKVSVTCSYNIKQSYFNNGSDFSVKIYIPDGSSISYGSLYLDKELCVDFEEDDNSITIPVTNKSGRITFNLEVEDDCKLCTYAILNYSLSNGDGYDIIDVINEEYELITLNSDDIVSSSNVNVSGIAPASANVNVYVNDSLALTVQANKAGLYSADINLDNSADGSVFKIKTETTSNNGKTISAQKTVTFTENAPELSGFSMEYNGSSYDLLRNKKYNITFILESSDRVIPFKFKVKYNNSEKIDAVYITSTRNQVTKSMKAVYDENTDTFIAEGFFDENDHNYVPGKIGIKYHEKTDDSYSIADIENEYSESFIPEILKNASNELVVDEENRKQIVITLGTGDQITYTYEKIAIDDFEAEYGNKTPAPSGTANPTASSGDVFSFTKKLIDWGWTIHDEGIIDTYTYIDENGEENTTAYFNYCNTYDYIEKEIIDWTKDSTKDYILRDVPVSEVTPHTKWALNYAIDGYTEVINCMGDTIDYNIARMEIMSPSLSESEKEVQLVRLQEVRQQAIEKTCLKMVGSYLKMVGGYMMGTCPPLGLAIYAVGFYMNDLYTENPNWFKDISTKYTSFFKNLFSFSIDPSGYVYEAVTSNRVQGANVTAYWIPFDEEDETYWDKPNEAHEILWNSDEYSQDNPLVTDADGNYAWDVPEGWWRVVVEKEGYETYSSDWMPVPPPQTDVNIALVSKESPTVTNVDVKGGEMVITFSKYINPTTLSGIELKDTNGNKVNYTSEYNKNEKSLDGTVYTNQIKLLFDKKLKSVVVNVPESVKSYSDVSVKAYNEKFDIPEEDTDTETDIDTDTDTETDTDTDTDTETDVDTDTDTDTETDSDTDTGSTEPEKTYIFGDVDGDSVVTSADSLLILRASVKLENFTDVQNIVADVNKDGNIDSSDALIALRYSVKLIDNEFIGKSVSIK